MAEHFTMFALQSSFYTSFTFTGPQHLKVVFEDGIEIVFEFPDGNLLIHQPRLLPWFVNHY